MACAVFSTKNQLQAFVSAIAADLGLPRPGKRQSDQRFQFQNQWTNAQFDVEVATVNVNGTDRKIGLVRGIPQQAVTRYGLNTLSDPVNNGDGTWNVAYQGTVYTVTLVDDPVNYPFRLPIPATWTDPASGVTYNTATGQPA